MNIFKRKKSSQQGCIVVIGSGVEALSQALLLQAQSQKLALYQVRHSQQDNTLQFEALDQLTDVKANLIDSKAVAHLFKKIKQAGHVVELVVFQPAPPLEMASTDLTSEDMQQRWQHTGLSAINIAQHAIKPMLPRQRGKFIILGSMHASAPDSGWLADGAVHAGNRALLQSLAREFQPQGIQCCYVTLSGWSTENRQTAQAIAQTCWHIYQQPRSAWSQELSV
ncbi:SDR family oxidoreductase [Alkanindiges illinoisensis]|uniref:SDR family oxidoreductase n=1 Tax=Alkanindiges illinoisensis TaxID=197183 RepID=UPI0005533A1A|nr:SDR family oxidoreductase [Alkanindiges illinoisensis]